MKKKELQAIEKGELKKKLEELQKTLMKENAQIAAGTVPKNPGKVRATKKTIARIKMMLAQEA